jgi:hypothetical protein
MKKLIFAITLIFFLPFIFKPETLLNRNNDLSEFRNLYIFFQQNIKAGHIPLWQNRILVGSPLLGDPQSPILYPFNYLLLIFNINQFFLLYFFCHFFLAYLGTFYLAKKLKFNNLSSLITGFIYAYSPIMIGHLEAGHLNMLAAFSWFPIFILAILNIKTKPKVFNSLLLGVSASYIFVNYLTIFIYAAFVGCFLVIYRIDLKKQLGYFLLSAIIFLIICLPQLIISVQYFPLTTRNLITLEDIGPKIFSIRKFLGQFH